MYTVPVWFGLFLTGIYVVLAPQSAERLPDALDNTLAAIFSLAALMCIVGAVLGTKWCMPRVTLRTSYLLEIVGLVIICIILGVEAVVTDLTLFQQFTLAGNFSAIIQIGSIRFIVMLVLALGRDRHPQHATDL
jgi:hypothetical protein